MLIGKYQSIIPIWLQNNSVVFRVKSKGLHLHKSQLHIIYVVISSLDNGSITFVVRYSKPNRGYWSQVS